MAGHTHSPEERIPGEGGIWFFVFGDMIVFSVLFLAFAFDRAKNLLEFEQQRLLTSLEFGLVNTGILLTGSLMVALSVVKLRDPRTSPGARIYLDLGILCGVAFIASKAAEWSAKISHGITLHSHPFFMYYFMTTGIHLVHTIVAVGILINYRQKTNFSNPDFIDNRRAEVAGIFWHFVDFLWIIIFSLLYLA